MSSHNRQERKTVGMYGKLFSSMYEGSLYGSGPVPMALWPYVIAHMVPDRVVGCQVELNPKLLADTIGCPREDIEKAIELFCAPDPDSRTKDHEGRRLVRLGQFDYQVVNGAKYRSIRDEEERREQNRLAKARQRARKATRTKTQIQAAYERGEKAFVEASGNGASDAEAHRQAERAEKAA